MLFAENRMGLLGWFLPYELSRPAMFMKIVRTFQSTIASIGLTPRLNRTTMGWGDLCHYKDIKTINQPWDDVTVQSLIVTLGCSLLRPVPHFSYSFKAI